MPTLLELARAAGAGDQITRLRRGAFGLSVVFSVTQTLSVVTSHRPEAERLILLTGILIMLGAIVTGYRRATFPWALRGLILVVVLLIAPLLGSVVVGAAYTCTWLLAFYPGARAWLTAVGFAAAIVIGEIAGTPGGAALDPGNVIGETVSLLMATIFLNQLRISLRERDNLQHTLTRHAHYDSLTDLPNRRLFYERLDAAVDRYRHFGEPYALLMLDLDDFKRINDAHGHEQGDRVLRTVAQRAAACVRGTDHCARLGGDEFAVLLEHCPTRRSPKP